MCRECWEQVAIEQLLSTLPRDVHIWVRERKPETVIKAGQLADDYALARKQIIGITNADQKTNVQQQPEVVQCQYCNKKGHLARECRKATADQARKNEGTQDATKFRRDRSAVRCYSCQQVGHIASKCPSKPGMYIDSHCEGKVLCTGAASEQGAASQQGNCRQPRVACQLKEYR